MPPTADPRDREATGTRAGPSPKVAVHAAHVGGSDASGSAPESPADRCRPLTLSDAMALVAATAIGLGLSRALQSAQYPGCPHFVTIELPQLFVWTITLYALRLRRPCPPRERRLNQPGAVACAVVTLLLPLLGVVAALSRGAVVLLKYYGWKGPGGYPPPGLLCVLGAAIAGTAVTGAWLGLAISGRRRPEPGWLDRTGRVLGTGWIVHAGVLTGVAFVHIL